MSFDLKNSKVIFSKAKRTEREFQKNNSNVNTEEETFENNNEEIVGKILHQWKAPEFEIYEKSSHWYLFAGLFIIAMTAYALITNSPIMAITFILIGIVGYIHLQKDPRIVTFYITSKGLIANKEMYLYDNINSFWIFYDPNHIKTISLHTKASMLPFIHIPISDEDPVRLRSILLQNIPEIKQDPGLIDTIERILHI